MCVEKIYKKCKKCNRYFKIYKIPDWESSYCTKHKIFLNNTKKLFIRLRYIPPSSLDIYTKIEKYGMVPACRFCGIPLLNKNGSPSKKQKICKKCQYLGEDFFNKYNFTRISYKLKKKYPYCQKCGNGGELEVHHIKPCFLLNPAEYEMVFDESNMIVLCIKCHDNINHHLELRRNKK